MVDFSVRRPWFAFTLGSVLVAVVLAGCASTQRLDEFELENRTVAIQAAIPNDPIVFHELLAARGVRPYAPAGRRAEGYEQVERNYAQQLEQRLQSAARQVNVARVIAQETGKQSAELLGMQLQDDPDRADYVLDVRVYDYGLSMISSSEGAIFFIDADVLLISNETGETVWEQSLDDIRTSRYRLRGSHVRNIDERDLAQRVYEFAVFASDRFVRMLRQSWRRV